MKKYRILLLITSLLVLMGSSCRKDPDVNIETFEIVTEELSVHATAVGITASFSFTGKIDGITVMVADNAAMSHARSYAAEVDGKSFTAELTGLKVATTYHYYYSVDYGFSKPYKTEPGTFTTQSEAPTVSTVEVMSLNESSYRVKCEVTADGGLEVTERGVCWNTYGDPTLDDETLKHANGGLGQYTLRLENLGLATHYYVRAYAKNATGVGFGEVLEFSTGTATTIPQVSSVEIGEVTATSATFTGNVASDGGLDLEECGVCWSLNANPTISGSHAAASQAALGVFQVSMTGLTPNKTYHARAYAMNDKGVAYGEDLTFTTTAGLPVVTTSGITEITATSAKGGGNVTDQGASNVTQRGVCWSTSHNPTTNSSHQAASTSGAGSFTVSMTGLTPNATYYVRAYATNAQGTSYGAEVSFTALEGLPVVTTQSVTDITSTTAKGHGTVTDQGGSAVTERGVCWGTSASPTVSGNHASSGTGTGSFTVSLTNLTPGTKYYVRAYAKNTQGIVYGEQKDFTTSATLPTVTTSTPSNVTSTSATGGGNVTNGGGASVTERGICWSTSHNPTTSGSHASSGTGTGSFTANMTNLTPGTTYYVRAYAINSAGISYGDEKSFTTAAVAPTVTTGQVSNITQTTAMGSGNVTNGGGANVTERGVCWSTSHNPTTSGSHQAASNAGTGSFTVSMTGLTANTHYYVRAYAKNSAGTSYGSEVDFTTSQSISAPTVTTTTPTNVTTNSATCGGNVTNSGGATVTERGVCWSTSSNPTTSGSHLAASSGGTGTFTVSVTGLTPGTTYHVRAYAKNSQGTSYGEDKTFITGVNAPTVTTATPTNVTTTSATLGGNVTDSGGATVTERGVCWSTSQNPTTSGSHQAASAGGTGSFTVSVTGLTPGTTYHVRAYAKNSQGTSYGEDKTFTMGVNAPTVTTATPTNVTTTSATLGGNVTDSGGATITERGVCWSTSSNPTTSGNHQEASNGGTGSFTISVTGLTPGTTYHVRAYAKNSQGTSYGEDMTFTTGVNAPTVTTATPTNVTTTSATLGGNVIDSGGATVTERGVCWSTSSNPTTSGSHQEASAGGTGSFTVSVTGLNPGVTYHVRAYAKNSQGTSYGEDKTFTTGLNAPTVTTATPSNVTATSATLGGNVTDSGGATVTERGVCWSTSQNPTTSGSHQEASAGGTGSFTISVTGLTPGTTYHVRAYAKNSQGTSYGEDKTMTMGVNAPAVTTATPTGITTTSAMLGGNVTSDGGATVTERGVCWSTSSNPTTSGSHQEASVGGTGSFTVSVTGLTPGTTYHVRAYAKNSQGTSYGEDKTFTTGVNAPTVTTATPTNVTTTSATLGGNVTDSGGATVTERGVCWSTSSNPTTSGSHLAASSGGTGTFTVSVTGLTPGTTYHVRAYAVNSAGTAYGSEVSFTTTIQPNAPTGAINGLFSVSASQQVWFSQGNLQYKASTHTWRFADNQYDYIGSANSNISSTYSGYIDLFGWGTSGYNHGANCYQPWSTSETNSDYYAYGQYTYNLYDQTGQADWGYNAISNGGNTTNTWRTPTHEEWSYVFTERSTPSGIRYAKANVNNINGVILLPDGWSSNYYTLSATNQGNASFTSNTITASQWNTLEQHGAVFLPVAGYRNGASVYNVGSYGIYWSASYYNSTSAWLVGFFDSNLSTGSYYLFHRCDGLSVRLVRSAQ